MYIKGEKEIISIISISMKFTLVNHILIISLGGQSANHFGKKISARIVKMQVSQQYREKPPERKKPTQMDSAAPVSDSVQGALMGKVEQ